MWSRRIVAKMYYHKQNVHIDLKICYANGVRFYCRYYIIQMSTINFMTYI